MPHVVEFVRISVLGWFWLLLSLFGYNFGFWLILLVAVVVVVVVIVVRIFKSHTQKINSIIHSFYNKFVQADTNSYFFL